MKIGIDLDDVLGQSMEALIAFSNNVYKTNLKIENIKKYNLPEILNSNMKDTLLKLGKFHNSSYGKDIKPVKDSKEAIMKIKGGNELYVLSSRTEEIRGITQKWINNNFPHTFSKLYLTAEFSERISIVTKATVCNDLGINLLIEDNLSYAIECLAPHRKILLFDRPWNQIDKLPKGIVRVHSWKEIERII